MNKQYQLLVWKLKFKILVELFLLKIEICSDLEKYYSMINYKRR